MRQVGYLVISLLMVTALTAGTASAGVQWCAEDPVFSVLGAQFRITTGIAADASDVSGISYVVTLPSDAEGNASVHYPQQGRLPTTVELRFTGPASAGGSFAVSAAVIARSTANAEVRVDVAGPSVTPASFSGRTNKAVRAQFDVSPR